MRRQQLGWFGALLLLASAAAGCAGGNQAGPEAKQQGNGTHEIRVEQTAPATDKERTRATEARLEQLAESIPEVKHANCVIMGNTAIVGIDVDGRVERSRVGTIKYAVAETLRQDPVGINAIVTADMDLNHRLQEIRQDMNNGRAMQGLAEELADIVGRIVPQLPRDTEDNNAEAVPEDPNAKTQEQGANNAQAQQNGTAPSNAGEPKDNRSFPANPANR
ncbi:YhcN/YlaJ family sporulation lipoprotein [Paenibacillus sp.]|uniref:YhcN/YlaJ family sporulation lipoprotein n=1 Tax=Paenibacillus sp. TaxID=58172 RepID=UPI002D6CC201|nr:YhcN/YlaJ family sporulation lipoprotein [Paenibacillus sp.]HZG88288.1 YhcN/YlaJ family sporulation lipoprotein [Paenibacillus sp.]